ncbi:MAG: Stealth CR1 domain-containing protein [Alphaproteobacteria bacterium]|nr:Stealth CR1 domain-containing protein [Alphaproteobacteria bacterium]
MAFVNTKEVVIKSRNASFPIDLVYLWVDGNDPIWHAKKEKYMKKAGLLHEDAKTDARFRDNDELKYSLRSVEMFVPWINHIYIVTDGQVPKWLNKKHPKISVIDHKKIIPADALPTFNTCAITSCIDNIPNLCEHFLLSPDDCFFGRRRNPRDFFDADGMPINVVKIGRAKKIWTDEDFVKAAKAKKGIYGQKISLIRKLVHDKTGKKYHCWPSHNLEPYRKSHFTETKNTFPKEFRSTIYNRFRQPSDIMNPMPIIYNNALGRNTLVLHEYYGKKPEVYEAGDSQGLNKKSLLRFIRKIFFKPRYLTLDGRRIISTILKHNPALFCVNDASANDDRVLQENMKFFESYFPKKSKFEL